MSSMRLVTIFAVSGLALSYQSSAQESERIEEMIVTGSRVMTGEASVSPITVVSQEDLFVHPTDSLSDYLNLYLPSNNAPPDQQQEDANDNQQNANAGTRQTSVDLRGLGPQYTLVLMDGKRTIEYPAFDRVTGWRSIDINAAIPSIAIGNIQVLADGGSAIYGSDAVAGVVNIVPDYQFEGLKVQARSTAYQGVYGSPDSTVAVMFGAGGDDTNMIFAYEHREGDEVHEWDTGALEFIADPTTAQNSIWFTDRRQNGLFNYGPVNAAGSTPVGAVTLPDPYCGDPSAFDGLVPADMGYLNPGPVTIAGMGMGAPSMTGPACEPYEQNDEFFSQKDREEQTLFTALRHSISDSLTATLEAGFFRRDITDTQDWRLSPSMVTNFSTVADGLILPVDHPGVQHNETLQPGLWTNPDGYVPGELAPLPFESNGNPKHEFEQLRGAFNLTWNISDDWRADLSYTIADNQVSNETIKPHVSRMRDALMGLGGPSCAPGSNPGDQGCYYFNPFMNSALPNADSLTYTNLAGNTVSLVNNPEIIEHVGVAEEKIFSGGFRDLSLVVSGQLPGLDLPGGAIGVAAGWASRNDRLSLENSIYSKGAELFGQSVGVIDFSDSTEVESLFMELGLPISDSLDIQLAARYEDSSAGFASTDPKIGFNWRANDDVTVRGSWGTSFRAPSIIHSGDIRIQERRLLFTFDPGSPNPSFFQPASYTVTSIQVGNPDLNPESSTNVTLGTDIDLFNLLDVSDDWGNMRLSLDYISIDFEDLISVITVRQRLAQDECNAGIEPVANDPRGDDNNIIEFLPANPDRSQFGVCFDFVSPWVDGQRNIPTTVYGTSQNFAAVKTEAIDIGIDYGVDTRFGFLSVRPKITWLLTYNSQPDANSPVEDAVGKYNLLYGPTSPEFRGNVPIGLTFRDDHTVTLTGRYVSGVEDNSGALNTIPSALYWDLNYTWSTSDNLRISAFVNNLTAEFVDAPGTQTFLPRYKRRMGLQFAYEF